MGELIDRSLLGTVPLSKVVAAAIVDSYGDITRSEQLFYHWAARGLKKLYNESLPFITRRVLLPVNHNTNTATLPIDFDYETFVGFIENNRKFPLESSINMVSRYVIDNNTTCPSCNQDKGICADMQLSEIVTNVLINGQTYPKTETKKLYPNGNYYLETSVPVYDTTAQEVVFTTQKEFIVQYDRLPCGCPANTDANTQKIQEYCPDIFKVYYTPCCNDKYMGKYKIFAESGLLQLEPRFTQDQVYVEYKGFMTKVNGMYVVPSVAFETLVEWTRFKSIQGKSNITTYDKEWQKQQYLSEKGNMNKIIGKIPLAVIVEALNATPKF